VRVALAEVGRRGRLDLRFTQENGRTILRHSYCETPFKITRPNTSRSEGVAHLVLMQCTAGLFGGDSIETTIHLESGANVRLTQQSATKIHPSKDRPAIQRTQIRVEIGAELQMILEPSIPFAKSRLQQTTSVDIEAGGRLIYWEGFMAGRVGRGETWQFEELTSETRIQSSSELLYLDRFRIRPGTDSQSRFSMDSNTYLGSGIIVSEDAERIAQTLHDRLAGAGVDTPSPGLVVVRVSTATGPAFHAHREAFVDALS